VQKARRNKVSTELTFTLLEQAALDAICEMHSADRAALAEQLFNAKLRKRENTGAGFYTHFEVDRTSSVAIGGERLRDGPSAKIDGLAHGMGFILWLKEGYADCLEGYSYEENTVGIDLEKVSFEIIKNSQPWR
jgi:hypothetical protein